MVPDDSWNRFCMLRRNFSMREESMLTRCGKFSRRQRTDLHGTTSDFIYHYYRYHQTQHDYVNICDVCDLLVTLVPSRRICCSLAGRRLWSPHTASTTPRSVTCFEKLRGGAW